MLSSRLQHPSPHHHETGGVLQVGGEHFGSSTEEPDYSFRNKSVLCRRGSSHSQGSRKEQMVKSLCD